MNQELKPCPFCGGEAQTDFIDSRSYRIECYQCDAHTGHMISEDEAIAAWNRRAQPERKLTDAPVWLPITAYGQVKLGDKLRFTLCGETHNRKAKLILNAGTDKEEIIYDKGRNYYLITSMAIAGKGSQKNVEVLAAQPAAATVPDDDELRVEFEKQHAGRNLQRHHLRGTYRSANIAALWNQHKRTAKWMATKAAQAQDDGEKK